MNSTTSRARSTIWKHHDFNRLWGGQSISMLGSSVTSIALPLTAVITLQATPLQVGLLGFMETVTFLPLALFAGVLVDRLRRRPLMVAADFGRAIVIG